MLSHAYTDRENTLLCEHVDCMLCCVHELTEYALSLQMAPQSAAALLADSAAEGNLLHLKAKVACLLKAEWEVVMECEASINFSRSLHQEAPHTLWQVYREVLSGLESASWRWDGQAGKLLQSWFPTINGSNNVEDVMSSLQDSIRRSSKRDCGSLANLNAVSIRAVAGKTDGENQASGISLDAGDYEGPSIRGLKSGCFSPSSCPSCNSPNLEV